MERVLDRLEPPASEEEVPEELVSHVRYCSSCGEKRETTQGNSHGMQFNFVGLTATCPPRAWQGERCQLAHGSLIKAFQALAEASREYERGLRRALQTCGDGPDARPLRTPVRLLDEEGAEEVARLRDDCGSALTETADALRLPTRRCAA